MRIFQYDEIVTPNVLVALKSEVEIINTLMDRSINICINGKTEDR